MNWMQDYSALTRRAYRTVLLAGLLLMSACGGGGTGASDGATAASSGSQRATVLSASNERASAAQAETGVDMKIVAISQVSETRVGRTQFDYVFKVTLRNTSTYTYSNVVVTLLAAGPGTAIVDSTVAIGSVAPGVDVVPTDTVTVRQDRTQPFNGAALQWRIEGTPGSAAQAQLAALEAAGKIPKLERGPTLKGIDENGNGVRDDIDAYIIAQYSIPTQRAAAVQTAKALQTAMLVAPQDITAAKDASRRISNAVNCIFSQFSGGVNSKEPARVVRELEAITANTKARLLAYLAYNKTLDGTSFALPDGGTCE